MTKLNPQQLSEKWKPILEHEDLPGIKDSYRRKVTAAVLENQEKALNEERAQRNFLSEAPTNVAGNVDTWDPVLISLVRRSMPNLMAFDVAGVQPMSGPTGLIFAMRSYYADDANPDNWTEALFNEADTGWSGDKTATQGDPSSVGGTDTTPADDIDDAFDIGRPVDTATGEDFGDGVVMNEMGFKIDETSVTAKTRGLKASYSMEVAQDLKAIHGLDAESELANILSTEILAEINRELVRTINVKAKLGAQNATTAGTFDLTADTDGRWSVEKYKGLIYQIEREANVIAKETRRGKGNFIICSSDVASALAASGMLDYAPAMSTDLMVDDTGNTFAGVLNGKMKVYIDPYAARDYINVGYRGSSPYDAGIFYAPYVPLTMMRAVGENDFQPRIGFKTRYGMVANPFAGGAAGAELGTNRANQYYRIFQVTNLNGV